MDASFPLTLTLSRGEREQQSSLNHFLKARSANPIARLFKPSECDSPSPWGEGRPSSVARLRRVEGEGEQNFKFI